jgi:MFS superfamily sulfate permease-like transporter
VWYFLSHLKEINGSAVMITIGSILLMTLCNAFSTGQLQLQARPQFGKSRDEGGGGRWSVGFVAVRPRGFRVALPFPLPSELVVVVLGEIVSASLKLNETHGTVIVGNIPSGLPPTANLDWGSNGGVSSLFTEKYVLWLSVGFLNALVGFLDALVGFLNTLVGVLENTLDLENASVPSLFGKVSLL